MRRGASLQPSRALPMFLTALLLAGALATASPPVYGNTPETITHSAMYPQYRSQFVQGAGDAPLINSGGTAELTATVNTTGRLLLFWAVDLEKAAGVEAHGHIYIEIGGVRVDRFDYDLMENTAGGSTRLIATGHWISDAPVPAGTSILLDPLYWCTGACPAITAHLGNSQLSILEMP